MATNEDNIIFIGENGKYNFDPALIKFREPRDLTSGARLVSMSYGEGKTGGQMLVQTPTLYAPMGKSVFDNQGGLAKHSIMLSLRDMDSTPELQEFQKLLESIDTLVRNTGFDRCKSWFRKVYKTQDTVNELYTPIEKKSKDKLTGEPDGKWPPNLKLTLPYSKDGAATFTTFNSAGQEIDIDTVELKQADIKAIMVLQSVWVAGGNMFGVSVKAVQIMVCPRMKMNTCAFKGIRLADKEELPPPASSAAALLMEDSDDEGDVGEHDDVDVEAGAE